MNKKQKAEVNAFYEMYKGEKMTKEELEKEAEENKPPYAYCSLNTNCELWKDGFQKGAEFGYKKGQSDQLVHKQYQLNQLRKANEWHYPSKGEYPDNDNDILCQIDFETFEVGYFNEMYNNFFTIDGKEIEIKAWKEIVLPKESE
jgi:hypothetical protein